MTQKVSGSISGVSAYNVKVSYEEQQAVQEQALADEAGQLAHR